MAHIFRRALQSFFRRKCNNILVNNYVNVPYLLRTLTTGKILANNYEGDGKTTVTILNRELKHLIMIDTFSNYGFRLSNGVFAMGPMAAFPRTILQWNVRDATEITPESLALFCLLEPKLDILVIGTGDTRLVLKKEVLTFLKLCKIPTEILGTKEACSTFNFLNAEGRYVAGAFIPPVKLMPFEDEFKILSNTESMDYYGPVPTPKIES